ncbi:hypothetical protein M8J76_007997 [Diaphorina citri]|nr:hypothetical protein M8J76_007997 [Diaphorina citri]
MILSLQKLNSELIAEIQELRAELSEVKKQVPGKSSLNNKSSQDSSSQPVLVDLDESSVSEITHRPLNPVTVPHSFFSTEDLVDIENSISIKAKVRVIGTSMTRQVAEYLTTLLPEFTVSGDTFPNAKMSTIFECLISSSADYGPNDYIFIVGGTNDIPDLHNSPIDKIVLTSGSAHHSMRRLSCVTSNIPTEHVEHTYMLGGCSVDGQSMNTHSICSPMRNDMLCNLDTYCDIDTAQSTCDKIPIPHSHCDNDFNFCDTPSLDLPINIVSDLQRSGHSITCSYGPNLPGPCNRRGLHSLVQSTSTSPNFVIPDSSVELTNESDCVNHSDQQENGTRSVNPPYVRNSLSPFSLSIHSNNSPLSRSDNIVVVHNNITGCINAWKFFQNLCYFLRFLAEAFLRQQNSQHMITSSSDPTFPLSSNQGNGITNRKLSVSAPPFYPSRHYAPNPSSESTRTNLSPLATPFIPGTNQHQLRLSKISSLHTLSSFSYSHSHTSPPSFSHSHTSPPPLSLSHTSPPSLALPRTSPPSLSLPHTSPPPFSLSHTSRPSLSLPHTSPPSLSLSYTPHPSFSHSHTSPSSLSHPSHLFQHSPPINLLLPPSFLPPSPPQSGSGTNSSTPHQNVLTILHQNLQSIGTTGKKVPELEVFLSHLERTESLSPDILCFTETWMSEKTAPCINIPGYENTSSFYRKHTTGGGVSIFTRSALKFIPLPIGIGCVEYSFEYTVAVNADAGIVILGVYRSNNPRGSIDVFFDLLEKVLEKVKTFRCMILCGDFNIDFLTPHSARTRFSTLLNSFNLKTTVSTPTRVTPTTSTCIDNICVNLPPSKILNDVRNFYSGIGDHKFAQVVCLEAQPLQNNTKVFTRVYPPKKIPKFLENISNIDFSPIYSTNDVNDKLSIFYNLLLPTFNHYFPYKTITLGSKKRKPWITRGIINSSAQKRILFQNSRNSNDVSLHNHYKRYCRILQNIVREAKQMYTIQRIQSAPKNKKGKRVWEVVREFSRNKKQEKTLRIKNGSTLSTDPLQIADLFNDFWSNVSSSLTPHSSLTTHSSSSLTPHSSLTSPSSSSLTSHSSSSLTSHSSLTPHSSLTSHSSSSLTSHSSSSLTPHSSLTSHSSSSLTFHSSSSFTPHSSLSSSSLLTSHSSSSLTSHSSSSITSHSSSSLTPHSSSSLTSHSYSSLTSHSSSSLTSHSSSSLTPHSSSSLTSHSSSSLTSHSSSSLTSHSSSSLTPHSSSSLTSHSSSSLTSHSSSSLTPHSSSSLTSHSSSSLSSGFPSRSVTSLAEALVWFASYLSGRHQRVRVPGGGSGVQRDIFSSPLPVRSGVPQGSVLGPLLFLLYINDIVIPDPLVKFVLFADDTTILAATIEHDENEELMQGLCAFVLGICVVFNDSSVPTFTKESLRQLILKRIGMEMFLDKLSEVSRHEVYSRAAKKPQLDPERAHEPLLDYEFCKLYKALEGPVSRCIAEKSGVQDGGDSSLEQYTALISTQAKQIADLESKHAMMKEENEQHKARIEQLTLHMRQLHDHNIVLKSQVRL